MHLPLRRLFDSVRVPRLLGHLRTVWGEVEGMVLPPASPPAKRVTITVDDPKMGPVRLRGLMRDREGATVVVIVPGITGTADAPYCARAALAAEKAGCSHLRIGMRGTDLSGEDIWHGGLTDDLQATFASPMLARFSRILLLGYSVGGHVALHAAIQKLDPRIRAVTRGTRSPSLDTAVRAGAISCSFIRPRRSLLPGRGGGSTHSIPIATITCATVRAAT